LPTVTFRVLDLSFRAHGERETINQMREA
jgi:hypothetical protein